MDLPSFKNPLGTHVWLMPCPDPQKSRENTTLRYPERSLQRTESQPQETLPPKVYPQYWLSCGLELPVFASCLYSFSSLQGKLDCAAVHFPFPPCPAMGKGRESWWFLNVQTRRAADMGRARCNGACAITADVYYELRDLISRILNVSNTCYWNLKALCFDF